MAKDIRIAFSFRGHRKRKRLLIMLGPRATDYLLDLWISTAMNHPSGYLDGFNHEDIAIDAGWEGDPDEFVAALVKLKFLDKVGEVYRVHDWEEHQPFIFHSKARSEKARESVKERWGGSPLQEANNKKRSERLSAARKLATHTKDEWEALREFFGGCVICGALGPLVRDHIKPLYQGGSDGIENLQPLCRSCNARKGPDSTDYRLSACDKIGKIMPTEWLRKSSATPSPSPPPPPSPSPPPKRGPAAQGAGGSKKIDKKKELEEKAGKFIDILNRLMRWRRKLSPGILDKIRKNLKLDPDWLDKALRAASAVPKIDDSGWPGGKVRFDWVFQMYNHRREFDPVVDKILDGAYRFKAGTVKTYRQKLEEEEAEKDKKKKPVDPAVANRAIAETKRILGVIPREKKTEKGRRVKKERPPETDLRSGLTLEEQKAKLLEEGKE